MLQPTLYHPTLLFRYLVIVDHEQHVSKTYAKQTIVEYKRYPVVLDEMAQILSLKEYLLKNLAILQFLFQNILYQILIRGRDAPVI